MTHPAAPLRDAPSRVPRLNLIYARAANGVIGADGTLPWHLPEDLAHFRQLTTGCPVLMGRRTWDSLPARFRPLPQRRNIVLTRQQNWHASGAERASTLSEALALCAAAPEVWVIGGAQLYAAAAPLAQRAVVTEIGRDFAGDVYAPELGAGWRELSRQPHTSAQNGLPFCFVVYARED